jgi:hypothetical protein
VVINQTGVPSKAERPKRDLPACTAPRSLPTKKKKKKPYSNLFPPLDPSSTPTREMSLYLEASSILTSPTGSLKSRIYQQPVKSPPARLYALIVETLKHQEILNEVITASGILGVEKKVPPPAYVREEGANAGGS